MLSDSVESYLALRRAAGFQLRVTESLLNDFARFATGRGDRHVHTATAIAWAGRAPSAAQRKRRLQEVIRFARHAHAEDPAHEIPAGKVFAHSTRRRRPYLFTPNEVCRLMEAAGGLGPAGSLRPHTYTTLFGLLAACGLRISEALSLNLEDVTPDGLVIRNTKFRKSRLVPMHDTTASALSGYLERRSRVAGDEERIFISLRGTPLRYPTVVGTFLTLVREIGVHPGPGLPGPRLHDLRHTFACRVLESVPQTRRRDSGHLLALTTYLGHAHVSDTAWYLQATPALMTDIADACEALEKGGRP